MFKWQVMLFSLLLKVSSLFADVPNNIHIRVPTPADEADERQRFPILLLEKILALHKPPTKLQFVSVLSQQNDILWLLEVNEIDVFWSASSKERSKKLTAIPIPIHSSLLGYRVLLIKKDKQKNFDEINDLSHLQSYTFGLGHDWPEVKLFKNNKLETFTAREYRSLFKMLQLDRFDAFPRAVTEIWSELDTVNNETLQAEENILLYYPYALYYYVSKNNAELASKLIKGFTKLIKTGVYNELFQKHHGNILARSNLTKRKLIKLENPDFIKPVIEMPRFHPELN